MKPTYIVYLFFLLVLSSFVSAVVPTPIHLWNFDGDLTDEYGETDLTLGGAGYDTGKLGQALAWNGVSAISTTFTNASKVATISFWAYFANSNDKKYFSISDGNSADDCIQLSKSDAATTNVRYKIDAVAKFEFAVNTNSLARNNWALVVMRLGGNGFNFTGNNTDKYDNANTDLMQVDWDTINVGGSCIGAEIPEAGDFIDQLAFYQDRLTDAQVLELYNNYLGYEFTGETAPSGKPDITLLTPANTTVTNSLFTNFSYNVSNGGGITTNCSLYLNSSGTWSINSTNLTITNATINYFRNIPLSEGSWKWNVYCIDNNSNSSWGLNNLTLNIDLTQPFITTNFINNSYYSGNNITGQFNISDDNLYRVTSFIDGYIFLNVTGLTITNYIYNLSQTTSNLSEGWHNLTIEGADGHTSRSIGTYSVERGLFSNYLSYNIYGKNIIKIESVDGSIFDTMTTEKQADRYTFNYKPSDKAKQEYKFLVTSNKQIDIISKPNSIWKSWLVSGDNWLDFYVDGTESVSYRRIKNNQVEVAITGLKSTADIKFSSIGDLNINTKTYQFNVMKIGLSSYINYSAINYSRRLDYQINVSCLSGSSLNVLMYIDGNYNYTHSATCDNSQKQINSNYTHGSEGEYKISFYINTSQQTNNIFTRNFSFTSDLYSPNITANFTSNQGFILSNITTNLTCSDNIFPLLTFNSTINNLTLFFGNATANSSIINNTLGISSPYFYGVCSDPFGSTSSSYSTSVYSALISLIDEKDNALFNMANVTGAKVYYDNNQSYYNFKSNNTAQINFTGLTNPQLRFELVYADGGVVTRYIDLSLVDSTNLRVCANKEGTTHYEQLITSGSQKPVVLKNIFSNCLVAQDYTRFAYQDGYILKAFTIASLYYLYTFDDNGNQIYLSSQDGSVQTYMNIDTLEFNQQGFNFNIAGSDWAFEHDNNLNVVTAYYNNIKRDNTALDVTMTRLDTNAVVFTSSDFTDPNEVTFYLEYSTLEGINESTLFKIESTATKTSGAIETMKRYYTMAGKTGIIGTKFAVILSLLLVAFGLTMTAVRYTFSWFGIVITLASIVVLSLAIQTWYTIFMMTIYAIVEVYIIIVLVKQNYQMVA